MNLDLKSFFFLTWPLIALLTGALFSLITAVFPRRNRLLLTAVTAGFFFALAAAGFALKWRQELNASFHFFTVDPFGSFLACAVCVIGLISTLVSYPYLRSQTEPIPEYYSMLLFAVAGMVMMSSTTQLLTLVLGLEVMSLSLYVLVGLRRLDERSGEGAFKYFLLGSVATAFMLFGISLYYGATGSLDLVQLEGLNLTATLPLLRWGALLLLLGFAFKVAAVPFHFWAPDVYDGAPMPVTGFMATGVKVAAFGALIRVIQRLAGVEPMTLQQLFIGLSLATMVAGNLAALRQEHLKRIMAYSSIAHAGYLLLGMATLVSGAGFIEANVSAVLLYLATYSVLTLGAFAVLSLLSSSGHEVNRLKDLDGLSERHPVLAAALSVFLISLAGIPPTAGFLAKYYLFSQAIGMGFYGLAILGILSSAVSLYYYLGPVVRMYFRPQGHQALLVPRASPLFRGLMVLMLLAVFYLGLFPSWPVSWTRASPIFTSSPAEARQSMPRGHP